MFVCTVLYADADSLDIKRFMYVIQNTLHQRNAIEMKVKKG